MVFERRHFNLNAISMYEKKERWLTIVCFGLASCSPPGVPQILGCIKRRRYHMVDPAENAHRGEGGGGGDASREQATRPLLRPGREGGDDEEEVVG